MTEVNKEEQIPKCRGSFRIGTACGRCERCKEGGFGLVEKAQAETAEAERVKDLPADRVKKDDYVARKIEDKKSEDRQDMKDEIKEELKPELKEEIKEELKDEAEVDPNAK